MKFITFNVKLFIIFIVASSSIIKINPTITKSLQVRQKLNIFISFSDTRATLASITQVTNGLTRGEKATSVYNALKAHADTSQHSALAMLNSSNLMTSKIKSFWISNQMYIEGADAAIINAMAALDEVKSIDEEITITLEEPILSSMNPGMNLEWGIEKIRAREAWVIGGTGEGTVVGIIDTGARATHEAIKDNFRGGTHSWYDPYLQRKEPRDDNGHGTHVTGTIAGKLGIGVAPGAQWISCMGLEGDGSGSQSALIACGEFMACPHNHIGNNFNCTLAPHVVSNSWGWRTGGMTFYDAVIDAWHAANIIPVFAAGNSGPTCGSTNSPSDSRSGVISVGATNIKDGIAWFSSRGPSNHAGEHKPDNSAPGVNIRSAGISTDSSYVTLSGTSMACPHVAGLVALLKSIDPMENYNEIRNILAKTAAKNLTVGEVVCGGIEESIFPNYSFGHGRIDALTAVQAILKSGSFNSSLAK